MVVQVAMAFEPFQQSITGSRPERVQRVKERKTEPDTEQVFLFRFSRTPPEFKHALEQGASLAVVREKMAVAARLLEHIHS